MGPFAARHRLAHPRLLTVFSAALLLATTGTGRADTAAAASYVISLGGNIVATANFKFTDTGGAYDLALSANVTGVASLVAAGTARADSEGAVGADGLKASAFDLITHSGGQDFKVQVQYASGNVTAFVVDPPIVNNIDRVPIERRQLTGVNDMLAAFVLRGSRLDRSLCDQHAQIFTGIERFDLDFKYAKDDVATSQRTGYQGPVVLCSVKYTPVSGHFTTSEITNYLTQSDHILVWYAPLGETGYFVPYRVLMTTSVGDLSMVLTGMN